MEFEETAPLDDGVHTYISIKFPLHDANGAAYAVCGISTDITEKKRSAEELARQRESLYQREKLAALGSLLAGVAHELNNPLSVVVARAVLLEEQGDPATQVAALRSAPPPSAARASCEPSSRWPGSSSRERGPGGDQRSGVGGARHRRAMRSARAASKWRWISRRTFR